LALVPIILLFAVMYLLVIRPQQRRVREHASFVSSLRYGDDVVTAGGIFGTITALSEETVSLEVAPGVSLRVLRSSVTRRMGEEPPEIESIDDVDATPSELPPSDDAGPEPH
jgi:preprotein translocase subunit YajC